jgi:hypothetical protein
MMRRLPGQAKGFSVVAGTGGRAGGIAARDTGDQGGEFCEVAAVERQLGDLAAFHDVANC